MSCLCLRTAGGKEREKLQNLVEINLKQQQVNVEISIYLVLVGDFKKVFQSNYLKLWVLERTQREDS